jgi:hypothetical protein
MKRDLTSFAIGVTAGIVLGLLVKDKHKEMIQNMLTDHMDRIRKKCDELGNSGKELLREGLNKAKDIKKDYL